MRKNTVKFLQNGTRMVWPSCQRNQTRWHGAMIWRDVVADATDAEIERLVDAYAAHVKWPGYILYADLKKWSGLSYPRIFAAVKTLRNRDARNVLVNINRMGDNTSVKLLKF